MKKVKSVLSIIILILSIIGIIYSATNIIIWKINVNTNNQIKKEINKYVIKKETSYEINFDELKKRNKDVVGYLKVDDTNIDYVLVKTNNNDYYLDHNIDNNKNRAGWIFVDYRNKLDGSDLNVIIYGHNMRDGSMFGTLANTLKKDWYSNYHKITLVTEDKTYIYQTFSTYTYDNEDYYLTTSFIGDEYETFIKKIKLRSNHNYHVDLTNTKGIITLSSCIGNNKKRVVLHAQLVDTIVNK